MGSYVRLAIKTEFHPKQFRKFHINFWNYFDMDISMHDIVRIMLKSLLDLSKKAKTFEVSCFFLSLA